MASRAGCCRTTHATQSPGMVVKALGEGESWTIIPWWVPREDVMALCKGMGSGNDKGAYALWGVPPGFGTSHKGWHKGHQGQRADKGKPVEGKGCLVHPGHADRGKPMEGECWGVHTGPSPSGLGLQCKHADKGKPV